MKTDVKYILKLRIYAMLIVTALSSIGYGQELKDSKIIHKHKELTLAWLNHASVFEILPKEPILRSYSGGEIEYGVKYMYNSWSLKPSIAITDLAFRYSFDVALEDNHPLKVHYGMNSVSGASLEYVFASLRPTLNFGYSKPLRNSNFLNLNLGATYNIYPTFYVSTSESYTLPTIPADSSYKAFKIALQTEEESQFVFSRLGFCGSIGVSKHISNKIGFEIKVVGKITPRAVAYGSYYFQDIKNSEKTQLQWFDNHLGIKLSLIFM